jgi:hypothetical protein
MAVVPFMGPVHVFIHVLIHFRGMRQQGCVLKAGRAGGGGDARIEGGLSCRRPGVTGPGKDWIRPESLLRRQPKTIQNLCCRVYPGCITRNEGKLKNGDALRRCKRCEQNELRARAGENAECIGSAKQA